MQNQKAGQVRRNPSRHNKNINQGQNYEKQVDSETYSNQNAETDKKKFLGNENIVDGGGVSDPNGNNAGDEHDGKTQQKATGKKARDQQTGSQHFQGSESYDVNKQFDDDEDFGNSTRP